MKTKKVFLSIIIVGLLIGFTLTFHRTVNTSDGWQMALPNEVGMDEAILKDMVNKMHNGEFGKFDALVIVKDGKIILDEYENGYNSKKVHEIASITKSITSLLIGMAKDKGEIKSEEEKIINYFNGYKIQNLDERKKAITIKDILTMRSGFNWNEWTTPMDKNNPLMKMYNNSSWIKTSINANMAYDPGTVFQYNSGGVILLDHIINSSTGMSSTKYAQKYLFEPLGIKEYFWSKEIMFFGGTTNTGGGLNLRPRDLAKIGQMVLNKGKWNGKQIVSEEWLNESFKQHVELVNLGIMRSGYGYLWYIFPENMNTWGDNSIYACCGAGGQYMFIIPKYNTIVVTTANEFDDHSAILNGATEILYNYILKSIKAR